MITRITVRYLVERAVSTISIAVGTEQHALNWTLSTYVSTDNAYLTLVLRYLLYFLLPIRAESIWLGEALLAAPCQHLLPIAAQYAVAPADESGISIRAELELMLCRQASCLVGVRSYAIFARERDGAGEQRLLAECRSVSRLRPTDAVSELEGNATTFGQHFLAFAAHTFEQSLYLL